MDWVVASIIAGGANGSHHASSPGREALAIDAPGVARPWM